MRRSRGLSAVAVVIAPWCAFAVGCGPKVAPPPPPMDPAAVAAAAISQLDSNKNGSIEAGEMAAAPGLRSATSMIDADKNGSLSASEISARLQKYAEFPSPNMTLSCLILQGDAPVVDADVRLVPEAYFGGSRQVAAAKSNANGVALLKVEGQEEYGVPHGIYRVEISKKDAGGNETLPSSLNSASQRGQEVAMDRRELEGGLRIEIP